jgi:hypothetical protein
VSLPGVMSTGPAYAAHAQQHAEAHEAELRVSKKISTARLIVFLLGLALVAWLLSRGSTTVRFALTATTFLVFGALVYWQSKIEARIAWHDAHVTFNRRRLAAIARDWDNLPAADAPAGIDLSNHPYASDLDLFGRASLFQWFGPAATFGGRATLAHWLLHPAPAAEILARQAAIGELVPADAWRADLAAHGILARTSPSPSLPSGVSVRQVEIERFLVWAEGPDPLGPRAGVLRSAVNLITASLWILIAAQAAGLVAGSWWSIPFLAGVILSFAFAHATTTILDRAGGGELALSRYAAFFAHVLTLTATTARLSALLQRLSVDGVPAAQRMRQFNWILDFGDVRRGAAFFHFFIQSLTLWDFHVLFALERWRRRNGPHIREWLEALGELDALSVMATARREHPNWAVPTIVSTPEIRAQAIGHPLIAEDRRVDNDVTVGPPGTLLLITGSNMSGKSTLLRSIGLNVVLAQSGACVCARRLELPQIDLQTSIRVQDSLERGLSYFMAALARLKGVVDAAEHERPDRTLVYLLDEILQGTNSAERGIAVRAVARRLLDAGAIGAMTTHDLGVAEEEPLKTAGVCVHFSEAFDEQGRMRFDYVLKPGLATSRNALRLMKMIGIDL